LLVTAAGLGITGDVLFVGHATLRGRAHGRWSRATAASCRRSPRA